MTNTDGPPVVRRIEAFARRGGVWARSFVAKWRRLVAIIAIGALVITGTTTALVVTGNVNAETQARAAAKEARYLDRQLTASYVVALTGFQPTGTQLVEEATSWAGSGSALLNADDIAGLKATADAVGESLARTAPAHATSAQLKKLHDSQLAMLKGAQQRYTYFVLRATTAAKAHLDAAPLADAASRQAVTDASAALEAAAKDNSSFSAAFTTLTTAVATMDAAQAAAVAAQAAAAAAAAAARHKKGPVVRSDGVPEPTCSSTVLACSNQLRAFYGKGGLASNGSLNSAAQACAQRMSDNQSMTHSPAVVPPGFHTWGENIAYGYGSQSSVFTGWQHSKGHHDNIINGAFTQMGLGTVTDGNGRVWWCQQFAG